MSPARIDELRRLCEQATPGPWQPNVWIETDGNEWRATGPGHESEAHDHGSEPGCPDEQAAQRDAVFIAAANPATVLELLDQLAAMTAALNEACDIAMGWAYLLNVRHRDPQDRTRIAALRAIGAAK